MILLAGAGAATLAWLGPPTAAPVAAVETPAPAAPAPATDPDRAPTVAAGPPPSTPASPAASSAAAPSAAPSSAAPTLPSPASLAPGPGATAPAPAPEPTPDRGPPGAPRATPASEPALVETGPYGPLPKLGPENRSSIRAYGRPFDRAETRPRLGLILGGLGMNAAVTEDAIRRLPPAVTLAFSPYAPRPERLLEAARARGMELLVALPLEPSGYPLNNPGDRALLTTMPPAELEQRLLWSLSRFTGYVGAIGALGPFRGERFAQVPQTLNDLQVALHNRGLLYIDPRPGARSPAQAWGRAVDLVVDEPATRSEIERKLAQLEQIARERGSALGYAGEPSPVLLDRIAGWANTLETRGIVLAPVTAMLRRPEASAAATNR